MSNARRLNGVTMGLASAVLINTAGSANTLAHSVTTAGMINGKYVATIANTTGETTPTTDARTGVAFPTLTDNQATVVVYGQDLDGGAWLACQGSIEATEIGVTTVAGAFKTTPQFPNLPDDFMVVGYQLIRTAPSAADFTVGVSNWNATGITFSTIQNCGVLPDRPQTS
jgi:hypothetical protein